MTYFFNFIKNTINKAPKSILALIALCLGIIFGYFSGRFLFPKKEVITQTKIEYKDKIIEKIIKETTSNKSINSSKNKSKKKKITEISTPDGTKTKITEIDSSSNSKTNSNSSETNKTNVEIQKEYILVKNETKNEVKTKLALELGVVCCYKEDNILPFMPDWMLIGASFNYRLKDNLWITTRIVSDLSLNLFLRYEF